MKKIFITIITITMLCLSFPINVSASESLFTEKATNHSQNSKNNLIGSGYNEAGIHYEIYGENILTCSSSSLIITRTQNLLNLLKTKFLKTAQILT